MRILRITPFLRGAPVNPFHGGKSLTSLKITNALIEDNHEVFILPWKKENVHQVSRLKVSNGSGYVTILPTTYFRKPRKLVKKILKSYFQKNSSKNPKQHIWEEIRNSIYDKSFFFKRAVERVQPDLVHVHYTHSDVAEHYRDLNLKAPLILTHHSQGVSESIPLYDYIIFLSHFQRKDALMIYPDIEDRSRVIHNCVSNHYLKPVTPQKSNRILFLSSIKPGKGFDVLFEAFSNNTHLNKYNLSVIGDGELLPQYRKTAAANQLNHIDFLGRLSVDENIEHMQQANLFVVPSRGEGFGTVYIEALCCGLPIIGFPPIVEELNETLGMKVGYEFDANTENSDQLAKLIDEAMNSKLTDLKYRLKFMKKSRELFRYEKFKENYLNMYRDLMTRFK